MIIENAWAETPEHFIAARDAAAVTRLSAWIGGPARTGQIATPGALPCPRPPHWPPWSGCFAPYPRRHLEAGRHYNRFVICRRATRNTPLAGNSWGRPATAPAGPAHLPGPVAPPPADKRPRLRCAGRSTGSSHPSCRVEFRRFRHSAGRSWRPVLPAVRARETALRCNNSRRYSLVSWVPQLRPSGAWAARCGIAAPGTYPATGRGCSAGSSRGLVSRVGTAESAQPLSAGPRSDPAAPAGGRTVPLQPQQQRPRCQRVFERCPQARMGYREVARHRKTKIIVVTGIKGLISPLLR